MSYAAEKVAIPLEDLIDKYAPNIKEALNLPGVRRDMTLPDGHIYSPPYVVGEPTVSFSPWINEVWLRQVGLSMPTTTAELKTVLLAFRDRIPAVNGQRIIPFSADPVNFSLGTYAGWFGVNACNTGDNPGLAMINGQLEITITRNEYKEAVKYFADLYKERLIDPEIFTQDQATWKAKGKLGLYGVSVAYGAGDFAPELVTPQVDLTVRNSNYAVLPVLKGPGVTKPVFRRNGFGVTLFKNQLVITDKAKDPITIIRWIDNLYESQQSYTLNAGPVGIAVEKVNELAYRSLDKSRLSQADRDKYEWGNLFFQSMPRFTRPGLEELPVAGQGKPYKEIDVRDAAYEPYLETETVPLFWLNESDARRVADIQTAIVSYVNQKQAEWVSGQADVDAEWSAYVAQLDRLGIQDLLTIKRNAMKR
jgi:putative aldouronate transport system substrate-binding protein